MTLPSSPPSAPPPHPTAPAALPWIRVAGGVALLAALGLALHAGWLDPSRLKEFLLSFGRLAPVIWVLLYLVAVFIPYATTVMTVAAGLAFGVVWGGVLTYGVTLFASLLPFTVARRLGREWVERRVGGTRVEKYVELINRHAFLVFFYLRLLPTLPYEVQNHVAGVTRISYRHFVLASALGNGPMLFVLVFLGDGMASPGSTRFWTALGIYALALLSPIVVALIRRAMGKPPLPG
jgi:uncharacterized membrane protein YdjX (TVP38/TMEM64 family)